MAVKYVLADLSNGPRIFEKIYRIGKDGHIALTEVPELEAWVLSGELIKYNLDIDQEKLKEFVQDSFGDDDDLIEDLGNDLDNGLDNDIDNDIEQDIGNDIGNDLGNDIIEAEPQEENSNLLVSRTSKSVEDLLDITENCDEVLEPLADGVFIVSNTEDTEETEDAETEAEQIVLEVVKPLPPVKSSPTKAKTKAKTKKVQNKSKETKRGKKKKVRPYVFPKI